MSGILLAPYHEWAKEKLGYDFENIDLLVTALTHRSYLNEHKKSASEHNERLEFLGDAVLELVTTDFLFLNYDKPEGILTAWRSALVRTESIGAAGERLGYEKAVVKNKALQGLASRFWQMLSKQLRVLFILIRVTKLQKNISQIIF